MDNAGHKSKKHNKESVKKLLSNLLGVEPHDISYDDSLTEDLQMKATDLTDFLQILENEGINTNSLNFNDIDTLGELADALSLDVY